VGTERDVQSQDSLVWFSADEVRALEQKYSAVYNLRGYVRIAADYLFTDVERRNPSHRKGAIIAFVAKQDRRARERQRRWPNTTGGVRET
jgi:hypothetical protein